MTKITFVERMEELMNCRRKQEEWINKKEGIVDINYLYEVYSMSAICLAAKIIEESICGFSNGWIEYFLYDCNYDFNDFWVECRNEYGKWINVELKDLDEFYDFLVKEGKGMNLKIASAESMRTLSKRNKPLALQDKLDKIQEKINIAAAKSETVIWLEEYCEDEIIDALTEAGYDIRVFDTMGFYSGMTIRW